MAWLFKGCALYLAFVPQTDIKPYELAYICSHNACVDKVCFTEDQFYALTPDIKRHFKQEK
jgi:putative lipase involved disintegration of autophagic bodies